ncbi:MAG TPA: asparagine synthase-related protein, partial [Ktedonobacteraceae bacterium]|nr:asparagine synthase-related protein [Ktedonobacteraceae bacterium]
MRVGFMIIQRPGHIEIHISAPENNAQSKLVSFFQSGDSFALCIGYLYYREEMLSKLALYTPPNLLAECKENNAAIALAAYRSPGMADLKQVEGDFALVIWDAERPQLVGLRDPLGGYPLFWAKFEKAFVFSTSLQALCSLQKQCELNEAYFAEFIMLQSPRSEGEHEGCVYKDIYRVLPGSMVFTKGPDAVVEHSTYWDWLKQVKDPGSDNGAEIAEQYSHLLQAAVQERLHGRVLAHLSGGMDSTSVALLAQHAMSPKTDQIPLHTASLVYNRLPLLSQERPYIESALLQEPEIVAHFLPADEHLEFDSFTDPPFHDEPYTALSALATDQLFVSLAATIGATTILTGMGADEVHHLLPHALADLLQQLHFRKSWQEATRWARARNCSPWTLLRVFGIDPLAARWIAGTRWTSLLWKQGNDWSVPSWILPDFARRYDLRNRAQENARQAYQLCEQMSLSIVLSAIKNRAGDMSRWSLAAPLGIFIAHPFLDARLLAFGLGMQARIQPEPGCMKPILVEAMRGVLPEKIVSRQRKGHFNEVYYLGLARHLPMLEALICSAPVEDMIDKNILIQSLREGSVGAVPVRQLQHANYMLSLLKWLCMQNHWRHVESKATQV